MGAYYKGFLWHCYPAVTAANSRTYKEQPGRRISFTGKAEMQEIQDGYRTPAHSLRPRTPVEGIGIQE